MIWIILSIAGGFIALLVVLMLVMRVLGGRLPEEHVASVTLPLKQAPETVFDLIADCAGHVHWSPGVNKVVRVEDRNGHEAWRQTMGRNSFVLETTLADRPRKFVRTIDDEHKMFSGRWEYEIIPVAGGCRVKLTEYGRIPNRVARFMMQKLMDTSMYVKKHLRGLAAKFNEPANFE